MFGQMMYARPTAAQRDCMGWPRDTIIQLVEAYRQLQVLWNPEHPDHRLPQIKHEAWLNLAACFNCDIVSVKRKVNSLLASYRRERLRAGQIHSRTGKPYKSAWFAYDYLGFLPFNKKVAALQLGESKTGHSSSQDVSYACEFVDEENTRGSYDYEYDESEFVSDDPLVAEGSGDGGVDADQKLNPPLILPQAKKKCDRKIDIGLINDAILRLDKVTAKTERMNCGLDDFEAFGRYVVTSLRRMDADGASEAQREMQRIVEDALKEIAAVEDVDDEQRLASRSIEESLNESETSTANVTLDRARVDEDDAVMQNDSEETPRSTVAKRKPNEYISIDETQEKDDEVEVSAAEKSGESVIMSAPPLAVKRKRLTSQSEMISHVIDKVDYMMNKVKCDTDPDNFELLGRYVSASLRKMPMQLALRVENDLYSIVIKHKLDSMRKCSKVSYNL